MSYSSSSHGASSALGSSTSGMSYSMFPLVEKTYRVRITEDIERDLRFLGQSRVDALTSDFDMTLVKTKNNLKLYELEEKEFFTMKGTTTVSAPIGDVMNMLKMDSTAKLREVMGEIFGALFLDGVTLYKAKDTPARMNESLSVNWMALQSSKPHLPHRDYVFLRYGDVFEKNAENSSVYGSSGSGLYVGASIWESIELDGTAPMPASANVVRLRLRRCGIVVEELNNEDSLKISLYMSEAHPGRASVSSLTKAWMTKIVSCVTEIGNVMVAKALANQNILSKQQFVKDGVACFLCTKAFSLLRRKHHCRVCGDVVCSKCSEVKSLRQGGVNKEIRVCQQCRNTSAASIRSSGSDQLSTRGAARSGLTSSQGQSQGPGQSQGYTKPSISGYSHTSSDASNSTYDDDVYVNSNRGQPVIHENSIHSSISEANSEPMRVKTYPQTLSRHGSRGPNDMMGSRGPNDMIMLSENMSSPPEAHDMYYYDPSKSARGHGTKDRAESGMSSISDSSVSEFSMYTETHTNHLMIPGVTEEELAQMELASTITENTPFAYALNYSSRQDWPKAPIPQNEPERLKRVRELHLVDPGQHFQEMCEYAAAETGCQIASICFVGDKSGFLMAKVGVEKRELPRNILLDAHAIMSTEPTIILDASEDIRFINNPLVTEGQVRFYAGFPLVTADGAVVGTFSVADPFARECLSGDKYFFLKNLADVAIRGVEQNTQTMGKQQLVRVGGGDEQRVGIQVPPPPDMNYLDAHMTMQELLRTAYTTQYQIRMQQTNPVQHK